jgi:hypothetical protein
MKTARDMRRNLHGLLAALALGCALAGCASEVGEDESPGDESMADAGSDLGQLEATAHLTGWHSICAGSLTLHQAFSDTPLGWGDQFYIDHFADGYNHAWGWAYGHFGGYIGWGWVYNGWFC